MRKRTRVCNRICHEAKGTTCRCFCGGLFHGIANGAAREHWIARFGTLPRTQAEFEKATQQPNLFDEPATLEARDYFRKANP